MARVPDKTGFLLACFYGKKSIVEVILDNAESCDIDLKIKSWNRKSGFQLAYDNLKELIKKKMPSVFHFRSNKKMTIFFLYLNLLMLSLTRLKTGL